MCYHYGDDFVRGEREKNCGRRRGTRLVCFCREVESERERDFERGRGCGCGRDIAPERRGKGCGRDNDNDVDSFICRCREWDND